MMFFDDPVNKIFNFLREMTQRQMRKAIDTKYKKRVPNQIYWVKNTTEENIGLSTSQVEFLAQRMTLGQISYLVAQRLWAKRTFIVVPALFIISVVLCWLIFFKSHTTSNEYLFNICIAISLFLGIFLIVSSLILSPFLAQFLLPNTAIKQDEIDAVESTIKRCVIRDIDANTPADFQDRLRNLDVDANGEAVAGQILAYDLEHSALKYEWANTIIVMVLCGIAVLAPAVALTSSCLAILLYYISRLIYDGGHIFSKGVFYFFLFYLLLPVIFGFAFNSYHRQVTAEASIIDAIMAGSGNPFTLLSSLTPNILIAQSALIYTVILWLPAVLAVFAFESPLKDRGVMLEQAVKQTATELLIDKAGKGYFINLENAKNTQIENVKNDTSPFIQLGTSTGILAQRRDPLAPTEANIPMGLTLNDLSTHLFVLGASGTGKTYNVIRPMAKQWIALDAGGMLVIDGKGALPLELQAENPGYTVISPTAEQFNPIDGMPPDSVADVLASIFTGDNEADPMWSQAAALMLRMAAVVVQASADLDYTLNSILKFCTISQAERTAILTPLGSAANTDKMLFMAFHYWVVEFPDMPDKTSGSIVNMVRTWLGNIVYNKKLSNWVDTTDSSMRIEDVCKGAKIGLLLPESEYGQGGVAISALVMRRLYDYVKQRGDTWQSQAGQTAVLLVADEVQNLLTDADLENVSIARSLGLYLVMATQNIDGLYVRLNEKGAKQMIGNFASLIALPPRTADSNKYISERSSRVWKAVVERFEGLPDAKADVQLYADSGTDRMLRGLELYNQALIGHPRVSYLVGSSTLVPPQDKKQQEPQQVYALNEKASATLNIKVEEIINENELDTLLSKPQTAIALINRGRVQRRDVIQLGGVA